MSQCLGQEIKGKFKALPNNNKERETLYISGPSGSGKTWFAMKWMGLWKEMHPNGRVCYVSSKKLPWKIKGAEKIKPTGRFFADFELEKYRNTCWLLDDLENACPLKENLRQLMLIVEEMLNVGREYEITLLIVTHVLVNYRFTKNIINECNKIVMFPKSGSKYNYMNFLKRYLGYSNHTVKEILNTKSRWLQLDRECPVTILTNNKLRILD